MLERMPTVSGRLVVWGLLVLIVGVIGIAVWVFLVKNPLHRV